MIKNVLSQLNKIAITSLLLFLLQDVYGKNFFDDVSNNSRVNHISKRSTDSITNFRLTKKYAELLKLEENEINKFLNLYKFIDDWMGTRYKWGGCDKSGIDCSCFIMTMFDNVFGIKIKRTSFTQFYDNDISLFRSRSEFHLGDLLFFKTAINRETRNNLVTHVGMYLANGYFVQSSSSGVNIGNLNSGYWKRCFVAAGRLKEKYYKNNSRLMMPQGDVEDDNKIKAEDDKTADFDPVPYPEDLDELKGKYATQLGIDSNLIIIPELFEYIDKYRYAPYNIKKECSRLSSGASCFVHNFYKNVLNIDINADAAEIAAQHQTARLKEKNAPAAFDIVLLKTKKKLPKYYVTGIYLYNNFFCYVAGNEVLIGDTGDSTFAGSVKEYYRIDAHLLKMGKAYIDSLRKDAAPGKQFQGVDSLMNTDNGAFHEKQDPLFNAIDISKNDMLTGLWRNSNSKLRRQTSLLAFKID